VSAWRHARAIALLRGTAAVAVPAIILLAGEGPSIGWGLEGLAAAVLVLMGSALIAGGLALWIWTVRLFMRIVRGTLAPWGPDPAPRGRGSLQPCAQPNDHCRARRLVRRGGSVRLAGAAHLCALFLAINWVYFVLLEEPGLERRFGDQFRTYRRNVPRWIPRRTPWTPTG
jgi:hypothetical protein